MMYGKRWEDLKPDEQIELLRRDLSRAEAKENVLIRDVETLRSTIQALHAELSQLTERVTSLEKKAQDKGQAT